VIRLGLTQRWAGRPGAFERAKARLAARKLAADLLHATQTLHERRPDDCIPYTLTEKGWEACRVSLAMDAEVSR
jgi:hypothetical protein